MLLLSTLWFIKLQHL